MAKKANPKAIAVYETDKFHSNRSRVLIGVFTDKQKHYWFIKRTIKTEIQENWDSEEDERFKNGYSMKEYIDMALAYYDENNQSQHLWDWEIESVEIELNTNIL